MKTALPDSLMRSDFEAMLVDRPCTVVYKGSDTVAGTKGVVEMEPLLDFNGILIDYRGSVWVSRYAFGNSVEPKPNQAVTVDGTEYQIMSVGADDDAQWRLDLSDISA